MCEKYCLFAFITFSVMSDNTFQLCLHGVFFLLFEGRRLKGTNYCEKYCCISISAESHPENTFTPVFRSNGQFEVFEGLKKLCVS